MPTESRALTNDYKDCKLIRLDANDPTSPLIVAQEGYAPHDPSFRMRLYYLQRDGMWIDEVARSARPESEIGDIVFDTSADAIKVLSGLFGKPMIRQIPVTDAEIEAYKSRAASGSPEALFRQFLSRYRASKGNA